MIWLPFLVILSFGKVYGEWLTYDDAIVKSPFKIESINKIISYNTEEAFLTKGQGKNHRSWFKVFLPNLDSLIVLDSSDLYFNNEILNVDDIILSKTDDKLLLITSKSKIWRYSFSATYYIYDLLNKAIFPLSENNSGLRNVKISPNGNYFSYVRKDNDLYVYNYTKKREKRLTNSGSETISNGHFGWLYEEELTGYDGYRWSPDSRSIAFWEEDESDVPEYLMIDQLSHYPDVKKLRYPKVGESNPKIRIGIVDINRSGRKWLDLGEQGDFYFPWMEWINNNRIAFLKMNRNQKSWTLRIAKRINGKSKEVLTETDHKGWVDNHGEIYFLKDGKIIWLSEKSGYRHINLSKHSGSRTWQITKGRWEVSSIKHIDEKNKLIYFMANKDSVFDLSLYSIRFDGTDLKIITPEEGVHDIIFFKNGRYFIDSYSSMVIPKKILLKSLPIGKLVKTIGQTDIDQFIDFEWTFPEIVKFPSRDGKVNLDGKVIFPPNFDSLKRYPVIIHGYGMPGTQIVKNQWSRVWHQYLAQNGFIVFSMDSRGMGGRGEDFKNYSYGDMSKYLAEDHLAGIDFLVNSGYADPNRIGAWGWSGGGYFTCLMLTRNGTYFKAGVAIAPCTDFRLYDTAYTERSMGLLSENESGYDSTNVISWIDRMDGSLLLMHGTNDDNVHAQHTIQFVQAALEAGKDIQWFQYPGRDHGIYGGGARKHIYRKMFDYFVENL